MAENEDFEAEKAPNDAESEEGVQTGENAGEGAETEEQNTKVEGGQGIQDFSKLEPEVRKLPRDYIRERQASRPKAYSNADEGGRTDEGGEELSDKAWDIINRAVEEKLRPMAEILSSTQNEVELKAFLSRPDSEKYRPYAQLARKYMDKMGMTAEDASLLLYAKYGNPEMKGAEEEKTRAVKASRARGGSSNRQAISKSAELSSDDIARLNPEQFAALQKRITLGEQVKTG